METGSFRFRPYKEDIGGLLIAFKSSLEDLILAHPVEMVFFEKPIRPFASLNLDTARKLYGLAGIIEVVCIGMQIPVREVTNTEAKKVCYGSGGLKSAEAKKIAVSRATLWGAKPQSHDEADAFAVWLVGIRKFYPDAFAQWQDRRFEAGRFIGETLL